MLTKLWLALRNNGHQVEIVQPNGETRPVLGRTHPDTAEEERRANVLRQWGMHPHSPRHQPPATIDEPLSQRAQTILSHQLPPELRRRLDSGMPMSADHRRRNQPEAQEPVPLDRTGAED